MRRIAYLSGSVLPSKKANSVQVVKMCDALSRAGYEVTLHARPGGDKAEADLSSYGVRGEFQVQLTPRVGGPVIGPARYSIGCSRQVRSGPRPDLLYGRHWPSVAAVVKSEAIPFVMEAHGLPDALFPRLLQRRMFRDPNFRRLVVISGPLKEDYLETFGDVLREDEVVVAHDGADAETNNGGNDIDASPQELGGRQNAMQVGYVGSLSEGKGMELISRLATRLSHVDFHIVGGTAEEVKNWSKKIKAENLHFHGWVPHERTSAYCRALDVAVLPMQERVVAGQGKDIGRWTSPLKLFEYMSCGKAIVASDVRVVREVMVGGKDGLLCAPNRVECWTEALERLRNDAALRGELGRAARARFLGSYTWDRRVSRVLEGLT